MTPRRRLLLACPDAFKQTASAASVAAAMASAAESMGWECDLCPLSDGGEGFAEVLAQAGPQTAEPRVTTVTGPLGAPVEAHWYIVGETAVIESAAASGLGLAGGAAGNDPVAATTRGTGELIAAAVAAGVRKILVGVGGSATTDGGLGAVDAIEEAGGLAAVEVVVACDVETLFADAAPVFGPQKGATAAQVTLLRQRLVDLAERYRHRFEVDVTALPRSGAAGGLAGGLAVLGARLSPGFDVVAEAVGLDARLGPSVMAFTGEGRLDATSWAGKVVGGVAHRAASRGTPVVVVVAGSVAEGQTHDLQVVSLVDRFGEARAMAEPQGCVEIAVRDVLAALPPLDLDVIDH